MSASISIAIAHEARFGVAVRRRRIAVDRAEVPLAVDERIAQREILHHAHERVVDRRVAVRVVLAEHVADDRRATSCTGGPGTSPSSFIAYSTRRCTGLSPSRTSGSARDTMTLIE